MSGVEIERIARTEEERTFRVNGEVLKIKPAMHAQKLSAFQDVYYDFENVLGVERYELSVAFVRGALEPGFEEVWDRVISLDATLPVTMHQLDMILSQTLGAVSGRPLEKQSDSGTT